MTRQPEALLLADALLDVFQGYELADVAAVELRRLHAVNTAMLGALLTIQSIALTDRGPWAKTIYAEASSAITKTTRGAQA